MTTGAISHAKLQSNPHHQQTNTQFFYRQDALPVAQPTGLSTEGKNITFHRLAYPKLTWGLPTLSLTTVTIKNKDYFLYKVTTVNCDVDF